ncbi:hypothetical protein E0Z10_g5310 [Xylaria hypoxylon]|uniref:Uncharacterized protein n=1 Tax=Xylaria hypoxylon TaxID=37992 RepID=A0A4Z0YU35_9PEZI|nr:hypothetical protein E0Z10_g5310 [Xylaria hypoxylon]
MHIAKLTMSFPLHSDGRNPHLASDDALGDVQRDGVHGIDIFEALGATRELLLGGPSHVPPVPQRRRLPRRQDLLLAMAFLVVLAGGKFKREGGWKLIGSFLLADAVVEFASMGIVAWLFKHDSQFVVPGWTLDYSFYLCTVSASVSVLLAAVLAASAFVLPPEDDYESLEDPFDS